MPHKYSANNVIVVMPAYNAEKTIAMTCRDIPRSVVERIIVVDDGSRDKTIAVARQLNLEVFVHNRKNGYGANQKTCYAEALRAGAEIVVMLHPYQYDLGLRTQHLRGAELKAPL